MVRGSDIILVVIGIIFPPAGVAMIAGCCSADLLINVVLLLLGVLPAHIHFFWILYKKMKAEETYGSSGGYQYLGNGNFVGTGGGGYAVPGGVAPPSQQGYNYGSTR